MNDNKKINQKSDNGTKENKKRIRPCDITGKIDVQDKRERRDGRGGN